MSRFRLPLCRPNVSFISSPTRLGSPVAQSRSVSHPSQRRLAPEIVANIACFCPGNNRVLLIAPFLAVSSPEEFSMSRKCSVCVLEVLGSPSPVLHLPAGSNWLDLRGQAGQVLSCSMVKKAVSRLFDLGLIERRNEPASCSRQTRQTWSRPSP